MTKVEEFVQASKELFRLHRTTGRGELNPFYMSVPVRLKTNGLASDSPVDDDDIMIESPLYFLSGFEELDSIGGAMERCATVPSVTLVVGEYGLGKTEFMFQLCDHLEKELIEISAVTATYKLSDVPLDERRFAFAP